MMERPNINWMDFAYSDEEEDNLAICQKCESDAHFLEVLPFSHTDIFKCDSCGYEFTP